MAKAFCAAMAENDCVVARDQWNWQRNKSDSEFQRLAGVTDLELEIANQRIRILTSHWPFKQEIILRKKSDSDYDNLLEKTVTDLFTKKFGWNEAHYRVAQYLEQNGNYENAAREYEAVIKVTPSNYYPYLELGDMLMRQREFLKAEEILKKGLAYSRQLPFAYAKLGMLYFFTQRPEMAVAQLNEAIGINQRANRFKTEELAGAYYLLGMAYGQSGKLDLAKEAAQNALKIKPNYPEAKAVIEKLNAALKSK
jgi:tetratricopeptide (TPR) repeat protein